MEPKFSTNGILSFCMSPLPLLLGAQDPRGARPPFSVVLLGVRDVEAAAAGGASGRGPGVLPGGARMPVPLRNQGWWPVGALLLPASGFHPGVVQSQDEHHLQAQSLPTYLQQ